MTQASYGNWKMELGTDASPSVLTNLEEVLDVSELGATSETIETTNWDSPTGTKEFIAGPAEGDEFTVECNYVPGLTTHQYAVRQARGKTLPFRATFLGNSPNNIFSGDCAFQGWKLVPSGGSNQEQSKIQFTFKISGAINET